MAPVDITGRLDLHAEDEAGLPVRLRAVARRLTVDTGLTLTGLATTTAVQAVQTATEALAPLLTAVRDRLPATLAADGRFMVDTGLSLAGLATTAAVTAVRDRLPATLDAGRLAVALPDAPLTDTQLRNTPLPIVGDVTVPTTDLRIDRGPGARVDYLGTAPPGANDTDPVWAVKRFSYAADALVAIDTVTDAAWTDRLTLTY